MQDRAKRLKLLNFMADKADLLYRPLAQDELPQSSETLNEDEDLYAKVPCLPEFLGLNRASWREQALKIIKPGHIILCTVLGLKPTGALVLDCSVLVSCGYMPISRNQQHIRAVVPGNRSVERKWKPHELCMGLVLEVQQGDMLVMSLAEADLPPALVGYVRLGHVTVGDLSSRCKRAMGSQEVQASYEDHLLAAVGFHNPNATQYLAEKQGLLEMKQSFGQHLAGGFPKEECATGLRKEQASRWAYRSVAKGVALFKKGEYSEAFQCLNQALNVDPNNVEGLVARGALYANRANYEKAILDFEKALNEDPTHQNAKKYMGETLVAQAKIGRNA